MTLPHQIGLHREAGGHPDSSFAAEAHAREWDAIMHPIPKFTTARKVVYLSLGALAVLGGLLWFWSKAPQAYTVDVSTPRGAVGAYFEALQQDDLQSAGDMLCVNEGVDVTAFLESTAQEIRENPMEPWPVIIWEAEPLDGGRYVVEYSVRSYTDPVLVVPEADGEYRVCGWATAR